MLGTTCTARVVEKSPVIHYLLLMMLYTRANYQAYICWHSLVAQKEQLDTIYHDWMHDDKENCLTLKLMKCKPTPNEVRKLIPNFYT